MSETNITEQTPGTKLIDSGVAQMMLGISSGHLRQLVHRGILTPQGRNKRRSLFDVDKVVELSRQRDTQK